MSTLRCTNIADTSGSNSLTTAQIYNGAAKAWVNFNGTSTVAIRAQFNVSSITDNGTGDYTVNFSTALTDANYSVVSTAQRGDNTAGGIIGQVQGTTSNAYTSITTTSVRINTINVAEAKVDPLVVCTSIDR